MSINVVEYGIIGDNKTDNTRKLQQLIDKASENKGDSLYFPTGIYRTGTISVRPNTALTGNGAWSFGYDDGDTNAVLRPAEENQTCILDVSHANGAAINGLIIDGESMGRNMCGISMNKPSFGPKEDCLRIEKTKVMRFSSHAVFLNKVWCFSVRSCMFAFSGGDGLRVHGWDGFILDNWLSGNESSGFATENANASMTLTGNRIEWNKGYGIKIQAGTQNNITGNYIDRSGSAGIALLPYYSENEDFGVTHTVSCTGNVIYRSGKYAKPEELGNTHVILDRCAGVTFAGNSMGFGRDDDMTGAFSPENAVVLHGLYQCCVQSNTMFCASTKRLVHDLGEHSEDTIIKDNVGSVADNSDMLNKSGVYIGAYTVLKGTSWYESVKKSTLLKEI